MCANLPPTTFLKLEFLKVVGGKLRPIPTKVGMSSLKRLDKMEIYVILLAL